MDEISQDPSIVQESAKEPPSLYADANDEFAGIISSDENVPTLFNPLNGTSNGKKNYVLVKYICTHTF